MFVDSREKVTARYQVENGSSQTSFTHSLISAHECQTYTIVLYNQVS